MNHRIFERKLRSLAIQGACLSERRVKPTHPGVARELQASLARLALHVSELDCNRQVVIGRLN